MDEKNNGLPSIAIAMMVLLAAICGAVVYYLNLESDEQTKESPHKIGVLLPLSGPEAIDSNEVLDWAKDKMVLLCFWEMGEPNSEQLARALNERQESLAERGMAVVLVEACAATRAKLKSWAEENKIAFPVGSFRERDVKPLRQNWVIQRLPWLVLTDKEHVVIAEGLGLYELDDRMRQSSGF